VKTLNGRRGSHPAGILSLRNVDSVGLGRAGYPMPKTL
jgi:hypothetical protein